MDIAAGERASRADESRSTLDAHPDVLRGLSDFGGMIALSGYAGPSPRQRTNSVGTKLKSPPLGRRDTVGQDCVAMCADDCLCTRARRRLMFLDYVVSVAHPGGRGRDRVRGVAEGCDGRCALLRGRDRGTPRLYAEGEYDLVGFAVGPWNADRVIDGSGVVAGDVLIGLPSSGLHGNGYSLARYVLLDIAGMALDAEFRAGPHPGRGLLGPPHLKLAGAAVPRRAAPHALAHITGGGIGGNVARVIPGA